jgi:lipopolysaccharide transport system permease protein
LTDAVARVLELPADREGRAGASRPVDARASLRRRLARARDLVVTLSESDFRVRYGRGRLRLLKWLVDPFALVGVYLVLVALVLDRGGPAPGLSIACAVVPFQLVMGSVINSLGAITGRASIILNMAFPRELLPLASVLTESVAFVASLGLIVIMMAIYAVAPTAAVLWLPVVLLVNLAVAVSLVYPGALVGIHFQELRPFAVSFVRTLFFLAPGLIALNQIPEATGDLVRLNPLTGLFEAYREVLLYGSSPAAWMLLVPLVISAVLVAIFVPIYRREQDQLAKVV